MPAGCLSRASKNDTDGLNCIKILPARGGNEDSPLLGPGLESSRRSSGGSEVSWTTSAGVAGHDERCVIESITAHGTMSLPYVTKTIIDNLIIGATKGLSKR